MSKVACLVHNDGATLSWAITVMKAHGPRAEYYRTITWSTFKAWCNQVDKRPQIVIVYAFLIQDYLEDFKAWIDEFSSTSVIVVGYGDIAHYQLGKLPKEVKYIDLMENSHEPGAEFLAIALQKELRRLGL